MFPVFTGMEWPCFCLDPSLPRSGLIKVLMFNKLQGLIVCARPAPGNNKAWLIVPDQFSNIRAMVPFSVVLVYESFFSNIKDKVNPGSCK